MSAEDPPSFDRNALVGTVLGDKYELLSLLGEGGMGAVYLGNHVLMRKRVAVKLLHPDMVGNAEIVARFEREAMAAAHIDHPNVAGATDFGRTEDGAFYLVLEYLEGASLRHVLEETPVIDTARAVRIARQIALGLARAHALGFVHRDLKPENVMIVQREDHGELVKVLDFGIAKLAEGGIVGADGQALSSGQALTQQGMMYGTPEYMSPEQVRADEIDARADLYALGIMLYEMLSGTRPFEAETRLAIVMAHLQAPVPSLHTRAPNVPPGLESLVMRLLAKEPSDRPESAKEVSRELDEIAEAAGLTPATSLPPVSRLAPVGSQAPAPSAGEAKTALAVPAAGNAPEQDRQMLPTEAAAPSPKPPYVAAAATPSPLEALEKMVEPARKQLPEPLRALPAVVIVGVPFAVMSFFTLLFFVLLLWPKKAVPDETATGSTPAVLGDGPAAPASKTATEAELATAKTGGASALSALQKKYPDDRRIWRPLLGALTTEKRHTEAMALLTESVGNDPVVAAEPIVKQAVLAALEGGPEATEAAFAAMEGVLGAPGADLLLELASDKEGRLQSRAWKSLAKPAVRRASPAIEIVLELKSATTCGAKKALLPRAKEVADKRALTQLKALRATSGCGFLRRNDCYPCLRGDSLLGDAIREAEGR